MIQAFRFRHGLSQFCACHNTVCFCLEIYPAIQALSACDILLNFNLIDCYFGVAIVTDPLTESIGLCHGHVNIRGCQDKSVTPYLLMNINDLGAMAVSSAV